MSPQSERPAERGEADNTKEPFGEASSEAVDRVRLDNSRERDADRGCAGDGQGATPRADAHSEVEGEIVRLAARDRKETPCPNGGRAPEQHGRTADAHRHPRQRTQRPQEAGVKARSEV